MEAIREFFGFGGYQREPEGWFSWQHIVFVSSFMAVMVILAVIFGLLNRHRSEKEKNRTLKVAAVLMVLFYLTEAAVVTVKSGDPLHWIKMLPLFLCTIQAITIPLAAFSKGRIREAALDFVFIFGIIGAVAGTYGAGQNYGTYPVVSFDNTMSALTHSAAGFSSLYIGISGLADMKRKNIPITYALITVFCAAAYVADRLIPYNYMFLITPDGTPYELLYGWTDGHPVFYPLSVYALFIAYISLFYVLYCLFTKNKRKNRVWEIRR